MEQEQLPTPEQARAFLQRLRAEYPGWSLTEIRAYYEKNEDAAGLMSLDLAIKALHPKSMTVAPTPNAADLVEKVPQNLPKGALNRAHYNNILTLYAFIVLHKMYQTQNKTDKQAQILQAIEVMAESVSNYASQHKSDQATAAAAKRAQKRGNVPPPQKNKHITAAKMLQQISDNTYLTYGKKLINNRLHKEEIWDLGYLEETKNEHHARRLEITRGIVHSVLKKLKAYMSNDQ